MSNRIISLYLLITPLLTHAQNEFRPIIDSLALCSYSNYTYEFSENPLSSKQSLEFFYIVEDMPSPKLPFSDIDDLFKKSIRYNKHEMTLKGDIYLQCVVNCEGRAGDFQILNCPSELVNIGCQALNIFHEKINIWEPGKQRGINVDILIRVQLKLNVGVLTVFAPYN